MGITGALAKVIDKDTGYEAMKRVLLQLKHGGSYAKAGVIGEKAGEPHDGDLSNVDLAMIHEMGCPEAHIPERSFIRSTFDANREKYIRNLNRALGAVLDGKLTVKVALGLVGAQMAGDMQLAISRGIPPPNSPATIAKKGSSKPLIDSGQMRQAISSAVVLSGE